MKEFQPPVTHRDMADLHNTKNEWLRERRKHGDLLTKKPFLNSRERELSKQFQETLKLDRNNAEAFYRYGFFLMELRQYLRAIHQFEKALEVHDSPRCSFPLEEAQEMKANMYIGICAGKILEESIESAKQYEDFDIETEGRSLDEVYEALVAHYETNVVIENGRKRQCSQVEIEDCLENVTPDQLIMKEQNGTVLLMLGDEHAIEMSRKMGKLLTTFLKECYQDGFMTLNRFLELFSEYSSQTLIRYISRINDYGYFGSDKKWIKILERKGEIDNEVISFVPQTYIFFYKETEDF
ncbi:hypothetical protein ACIQ4I_00085 [Rummeliibacillus sp. NPDC094406]|uniref:hypothetical protein n=1 Tax=Rummeliibacillus sp. NPDC094406 TaxID=3364511 RepID=UPI0037F8D991